MANLVRRSKRLNGLEKAYEERDAGFTFLVLFLFKWNKSMIPSATTLASQACCGGWRLGTGPPGPVPNLQLKLTKQL